MPRATRGRDNARKVNGRKRHIAVDAAGLVLAVVITAASVQDCNAARPLLWNLHRTCKRVLLVWADAGYVSGKLASWATVMKTVSPACQRKPPEHHSSPVTLRRCAAF
jgi:transposase